MPVQVGSPKQEKLAENKSPVPSVAPPKVPVTVCAIAPHDAQSSAAAHRIEVFIPSPRAQNNCRRIVLVALTPSTVYESTALLASTKLTMALPTEVACTRVGSSGGPKGGP